MNNPDPEVQKQYKEIFQKHFDKLISEGITRDRAAGDSLLFLQQVINNSSNNINKPPTHILEDEKDSDNNNNNNNKDEIENKMVISEEIKENKIEIENNLSKDLNLEDIPLKSENLVKTLTYEELMEIFSNTESSESITETIKTIGSIFSSSEILNSSFCIKGFETVEDFSEKDIRLMEEKYNDEIENILTRIDLDLHQINQLFKYIMQSDNISVRNSLSHALEALTASIAINYSSHLTAKDLKQYIIVLEYPDLLDPSKDGNVLINLSLLIYI
jgi:hypothetical protein